MEYHYYDVPYSSKAAKFQIIPLGDIHLGTKCCDKKRFQETVEYIRKTPATYWLGMGDYAESISVKDDRFDYDNVDPIYQACLPRMPRQVTEDLIEYLKPIKHKCIGLLTGNHEVKFKNMNQIDLTYELAKALDTQFLGFSAFIRVSFKRNEGVTGVDIYATHSNVAGRKSGGKVNRLEDMFAHFDADVILIAHGHKKTTVSLEQLALCHSRTGIRQKHKVAGMTGSFYRTYQIGTTSYAERGGYPPSALGVIKVIVEPYKGELSIVE